MLTTIRISLSSESCSHVRQILTRYSKLKPPDISLYWPRRLGCGGARGFLNASIRLEGKSRDQVNRDIRARRLLALIFGNRGQRIPDRQLDPLKRKLVLAVLTCSPEADSWSIYQLLSKPHGGLRVRAPVEAVTHENFEDILGLLA